MPKLSFTTLVAVVLAAGIAYLAFNPDAAQYAADWVRSQFAGGPAPGRVAYPSYTPVIPGK